MIRAKIVGTGSYAPEKILTNDDLAKFIDTSDEWIKSRTGMSERRVAAENQATSDLCAEAAKPAFEMSGIKPEEIDLIIAATVTPDYQLPSLSCVVQKKLGTVNAATMDIVAACAGFIHGLSMAQAYIATGTYKKIMVFGAEVLSNITNYEDRNTCVLFGDGAGVAILVPSEDESGILSTYLKSDGRLDELLYIPVGGAKSPFGRNGNLDSSLRYINMKGNEIYKNAVRYMGDAAFRVVKEAGLEIEQIDLLVPHQANIRIIKAVASRLGMPMEKVFLNLEKYGNTSAASVPLALDEALRQGRIKSGDYVLSVAFGGGLTWGAVVIRW